jgi:predicted metal-dependent hydrolase
MEGGTLIVFILSLVLIYLIWDTYFSNEVEYVRSTIDNEMYLVRSLPDKQEAADLIAKIRGRLETFVDHLTKNKSDDERVKRIQENFRADKISEGSENAKYTSYSINKGEKIVLCIRSRDEKKKLVDLNTMMFVVLHELAHIATVSIGHTPEFWDNFKWILKEAVGTNTYISQDFRSKPVEYCGIQITDNPLHSS